ncbi:MAG: FAD-dependent thymidylate synthase, partial [Clostridia bacterium]|nr:FAD-dependent thymidylate synthase [Clostridia bacterium]
MAKVTLIAHTPDPERTIACAAKLCYSPATIETVHQGLTDDKVASFVEMLSEIGHESP